MYSALAGAARAGRGRTREQVRLVCCGARSWLRLRRSVFTRVREGAACTIESGDHVDCNRAKVHLEEFFVRRRSSELEVCSGVHTFGGVRCWVFRLRWPRTGGADATSTPPTWTVGADS